MNHFPSLKVEVLFSDQFNDPRAQVITPDKLPELFFLTTYGEIENLSSSSYEYLANIEVGDCSVFDFLKEKGIEAYPKYTTTGLSHLQIPEVELSNRGVSFTKTPDGSRPNIFVVGQADKDSALLSSHFEFLILDNVEHIMDPYGPPIIVL
ncbi:hypothetical protein PT974_02152 [Cladobotryum mycophilum]|uniref:Uncharacterized protein n=1 Tax=Cladobotryum mycophilum TaxID=491253 RepID=A0ABR0SXF5_9HYPO